MTKQASEIMKLNFMTDQGSKRETIRWAWRALAPPPFLSFLSFLSFLGTCCGRGIRDAAADQADGRSTRVVSASDGADGPDGADAAIGPDDAAGPDGAGTGLGCSSVRGEVTRDGDGGKAPSAGAAPKVWLATEEDGKSCAGFFRSEPGGP